MRPDIYIYYLLFIILIYIFFPRFPFIIVNVHMPKDRISGVHQFYGFVEFLSEDDADYAIKVLNMIKLFGKPIRVNKAASNERTTDVGANLFVRPHPYRWRLGVGACSSHESAEASPWF